MGLGCLNPGKCKCSTCEVCEALFQSKIWRARACGIEATDYTADGMTPTEYAQNQTAATQLSNAIYGTTFDFNPLTVFNQGSYTVAGGITWYWRVNRIILSLNPWLFYVREYDTVPSVFSPAILPSATFWPGVRWNSERPCDVNIWWALTFEINGSRLAYAGEQSGDSVISKGYNGTTPQGIDAEFVATQLDCAAPSEYLQTAIRYLPLSAGTVESPYFVENPFTGGATMRFSAADSAPDMAPCPVVEPA